MAKKIYVGNLPYSFTSVELEKLFSPFGAVRSAEVINDRNTGQSRGFGFVEMESDEAMQAAIDKLNGSDCEGRPLRVNEARERTPRPSGSYGGGGGGGHGGGRGRGGYGGGRGGDRGERRDRGDRRDRFDRGDR